MIHCQRIVFITAFSLVEISIFTLDPRILHPCKNTYSKIIHNTQTKEKHLTKVKNPLALKSLKISKMSIITKSLADHYIVGLRDTFSNILHGDF